MKKNKYRELRNKVELKNIKKEVVNKSENKKIEINDKNEENNISEEHKILFGGKGVLGNLFNVNKE